MLETLQPVPGDPILALIALHARDPNPRKVDLGVGVYREADGSTPVLRAVKEAEGEYLARQQTKSYVGPAGDPDFNAGVQRLLFGADHPAVRDDRVRTVQAAGGSGALRLAAGLIVRSSEAARVWVSDPTWANHVPLLSGAGVRLESYPYYDSAGNALRFDEMLAALGKAKAGDVVLLHGCCHNPCGEDLGPEHWQAVAELAERRGFVPFVDIAYQGFSRGVDEDAAGVRLLAERLPEVLVVSSCAKNFAIYRERAGAVSVVAAGPSTAEVCSAHVQNVARGIYSMAPAHGAAIVGTILKSERLTTLWLDELAAMRGRLNAMRAALAERLSAGGRDFGFIARQRGMFSFLGVSAEQVARLREEFSIYIVDSSRINVAGLNDDNLPYVADAVRAVLD